MCSVKAPTGGTHFSKLHHQKGRWLRLEKRPWGWDGSEIIQYGGITSDGRGQNGEWRSQEHGVLSLGRGAQLMSRGAADPLCQYPVKSRGWSWDPWSGSRIQECYSLLGRVPPTGWLSSHQPQLWHSRPPSSAVSSITGLLLMIIKDWLWVRKVSNRNKQK